VETRRPRSAGAFSFGLVRIVMAERIRYARTMRIPLILLGCILAATALAESRVYKSVDSEGVVEFSDRPASGAKPVTVTPNVVTMPAVSSATTGEAEEPAEPDLGPTYTKVEITSPKEDEAIRSNAGNFAAMAVVEPGLFGDHRIQWRFDGKVLPGATTTFLSMRNVDRGTHTIQLEIVNAAGEVVKASDPVTFHLLRVALGGGGP